LLIVTIFLTLDSGENASADEYGSPQVTSELGVLTDSLDDPAIGAPAPEVIGADFDGNEVSIANDGQAKMLVFLAHWCPHCQNEVPRVSQWLADTELPANVDFFGVATAIDRKQDNWPPSEWLEQEGFSAPVLVDDRVNSIGDAFGLPAYPYWVFIAEDGTVAARISGGLSVADLDRVLASLTAG
jgi:thiol-disulfide isomerase/thioredoxin